MNYFELFDIPISIKVDKAFLAKKYFELQKEFHPDFFSQATEHEQTIALEKSSQANKALSILKNEDETIKYILQLKGLLETDEKYQLPQDFLMEVMDLNEGLDEATVKEVKELELSLYQPVKDIIERYNDEIVTYNQLQNIKEYYFKKNIYNVFWRE
ncbi:MAG: Fe-S protein assembly co-chaperone HscB [Chitinophagaceae bacterium]|nr:Fe-S protein assembly co-chaperone HscB [Chitinophagaceae bacterium]